MLTNKWRIFKKTLEVSLRRVGKIILASFRLHNFCINQRNEKIPFRVVNFIELKRTGDMKGRMVADRRSQKNFTTKKKRHHRHLTTIH